MNFVLEVHQNKRIFTPSFFYFFYFSIYFISYFYFSSKTKIKEKLKVLKNNNK